MKTARKTYLLTGLVCAGLLWAGATAFGQPDPLPQIQQEFPPSEPDDRVADPYGTQARDPSEPRPVAPTQAGEPAPARGTTVVVRDEYNRLIRIPLNTGGDALLKDLGAPGVTLQELQQADQQLELRLHRLVELYTRAIRGEAPKVTETIRESRVQLANGEQATIQEPYSRALHSEKAEDVADPAQIREAIVALVNKQFQIRQAMRKMEISSLEERVQRLNDLLQKREEAQAQIVESRLSQLLNAAEGLGWDNAADRGATSRPAGFFRPGVPGQMRGSTSGGAPPTARYETYDPFRAVIEPDAASPAPPSVPRIDR